MYRFNILSSFHSLSSFLKPYNHNIYQMYASSTKILVFSNKKYKILRKKKMERNWTIKKNERI